MKFKSLKGKPFGYLAVIEEDSKHCTCRCECGIVLKVSRNNLISGHTKSCGCLRRKRTSENFKKHGQSNTRLHNIWRDIIKRCTNKKYRQFYLYGGRGIEVCADWLDFENFYIWAISNGYHDSLTIDRIDTNGNYDPNNCRWTTQKKQNNNKRNNHRISYKNKALTISEWSEVTGISSRTLWYRINAGWPIEEAFHTPVGGKRL